MRRWRIIPVVAVLAALVVWLLAFRSHIVWDGSYELSVHIETDRPVRAVVCESISGPEDRAEEELAWVKTFGRPEAPGPWSTVRERYDGQPIPVQVAVSGKDSYLGYELERSQFRYLVVVVTYPDGSRQGKVVDIPDERLSHKVRVTFP